VELAPAPKSITALIITQRAVPLRWTSVFGTFETSRSQLACLLTGEERKWAADRQNDAIDPERKSVTPKDISIDRPRRLPSVEFGQLHCRLVISWGEHAAT